MTSVQRLVVTKSVQVFSTVSKVLGQHSCIVVSIVAS